MLFAGRVNFFLKDSTFLKLIQLMDGLTDEPGRISFRDAMRQFYVYVKFLGLPDDIDKKNFIFHI